MALDFDWRFSLKTGDLIDVVEFDGRWHLCTILECHKFPEKSAHPQKYPFTKLLVGFRVFNENGNKETNDGKKYFGLEKNQRINVISSRIRK